MKRTTSVFILLIAIVFLATVFQTEFRGASFRQPQQYLDNSSVRRSLFGISATCVTTNAGFMNERDEVKLGTQLHRQATKKFRLTDVGLNRVERLGQRIARASARPNLLYKFHVIESREINGLSLPGGHIYITTGLLKIANDNELASVLGHEVGHIAARHSLKTLKKRQGVRRLREINRRDDRCGRRRRARPGCRRWPNVRRRRSDDSLTRRGTRGGFSRRPRNGEGGLRSAGDGHNVSEAATSSGTERRI